MKENKQKNILQQWYYNDWFLGLLFSTWFFVITPVIAVILTVKKQKKLKPLKQKIDSITNLEQLKVDISDLENNKQNLNDSIVKNAEHQAEILLSDSKNELNKIKQDITLQKSEKDKLYKDILAEAKIESDRLLIDNNKQLDKLKEDIETQQNKKQELHDSIVAKAQDEAEKLLANSKEELEQLKEVAFQKKDCEEALEKLNKKINSQKNKLVKISTIHKSIKNTVDNYIKCSEQDFEVILDPDEILVLEEIDLSPTVSLKLHSMDVKNLRKAFRDNDKIIKETLDRYEGRYNTKANIAIYKLMVIALKAELQNVLYNLRYDTLKKSILDIENITKKYLEISSEGNQSIAPTIARFIGEIEFLFINSIKIEYEYYTKKQREKEEQAALREQMKQEAAERKVLEEQQKQVEREEEKYKSEIIKVQEQMTYTHDDEALRLLQERIAELQGQLETVEHEKEDIISRQNGKAGYVYVISNLGSFGDSVFKVGMTRRLDPQDRIKELSSASVPFSFDVHSFIFSDNAVKLEHELHCALDENRVNKVNLRKEFFNVSLDRLEDLVESIDPTAEFSRTVLAEDYRETLSIQEYIAS